MLSERGLAWRKLPLELVHWVRLGNGCVRAISSGIEASPVKGIIWRPLVLRHCLDAMPLIVLVVSVVGVRSESSMPNSPTTSG